MRGKVDDGNCLLLPCMPRILRFVSCFIYSTLASFLMSFSSRKPFSTYSSLLLAYYNFKYEQFPSVRGSFVKPFSAPLIVIVVILVVTILLILLVEHKVQNVLHFFLKNLESLSLSLSLKSFECQKRKKKS